MELVSIVVGGVYMSVPSIGKLYKHAFMWNMGPIIFIILLAIFVLPSVLSQSIAEFVIDSSRKNIDMINYISIQNNLAIKPGSFNW